MNKKPYSLLKRKLPSGRTVYYVRFRKDDGGYYTAKSSGQTTKSAAEAWAIEYLKTGQVVMKENLTLSMYAEDFFAWEGEYISALRRKGRQIGQRYAENKQGHLRNYILPALGAVKISRIDEDMIESFARDLLEDDGLAAATVNQILLTLKAVLKQAYRKKFIRTLPLVENVSGSRKERGIPTPEEVKAFFGGEWKDRRYYAINMLAATTGMRMGEIQALQRKALREDFVEVNASWAKGYGLKGTKTGRARYIPLPARTLSALSEVLEFSPYTEPEDFVFFGRYRTAPLDNHLIEESFNRRLKEIGIDEETRKARNLSFHSWRHYFNSILINARVPILKVQALTGHSTLKMTENYFHVDDLRDVLKVLEDVG